MNIVYKIVGTTHAGNTSTWPFECETARRAHDVLRYELVHGGYHLTANDVSQATMYSEQGLPVIRNVSIFKEIKVVKCVH